MRPLLSPLLALSLIASVLTLAQPVQAAPDDSVCDLEGAGTELYPYSVASVDDFEEISDCVGSGVYFQQLADIDFTSTVRDSFGDFHGVFDGNGFLLSNLQNVASLNGERGLFSSLSGASEFRDMVFDEPEISGRYVGALLGTNSGFNLTIKDTRLFKGTAGSVFGTEFAGGLVGRVNGGELVVQRVYSEIEVDATCFAGGLFGQVSSALVNISDVYVNADLTLTGCSTAAAVAGGLMGELSDEDPGGSIDSVAFSGSIENVPGNGASYVGGFFGGLYQANFTATQLTNLTTNATFSSSQSSEEDYYGGVSGVVVGDHEVRNAVLMANHGNKSPATVLCDVAMSFKEVFPTNDPRYAGIPSDSVETFDVFVLDGSSQIQTPSTDPGCAMGGFSRNAFYLADNSNYPSFDIETDADDVSYPNSTSSKWVMETDDAATYGSSPTLMFAAAMGAEDVTDTHYSVNIALIEATDSKFDEVQSGSQQPETVWVKAGDSYTSQARQVDVGNGLEDVVSKTGAVFAGFGIDPNGTIAPIADEQVLTITENLTLFSNFYDECGLGGYSSTGFEEILTIQVGGQDVDILDCIQAPAGSYVDSTGATEATPASAGHFVSFTGASSEEQCPAGFYQPNTGQSECLQSGKGFSADTGSASRTQCIEGTFGPENSNAECLDAPPGTYVNIKGMSEAINCEKGFYQPDAGEMVCLWAGAGFYVASEGSDSREACQPGTYSEDGPNETCTEAPAGTYVDIAQATTATTVRAGYHTPEAGMTAEVACDPGTFQPDPGQQSCINAEPGYYVPESAATEQLECPAGETSNAGAVSCLVTTSGGGSAGPIFSSPPTINESSQQGTELTIEGDGFEDIQSVFIGETELEIISRVGNALVINTAGLAAEEIVFNTSSGSFTVSVNVVAITADATSTKFWTKQISPNEIKLYAKNIVAKGKIQFFHDGNEVAWVRAADETDPKLRVIESGPMAGSNYLVRTRALVSGKNIFEINVDGERVLRRAQGN